MRYLFAALIVLAACSPAESLPTACSPACAAGQVCVNAQCLAPVDGGADAARDVAAVDAPPADVAAQESGAPDAAVDAVIDSGSAVDVAPEAAVDVAPDALTCTMGFGDCDGIAANGCEADTQIDWINCGRCGVTCPSPDGAHPMCSSGVCGITCVLGVGNCDGNAANGCETRLDTSAHCGSCSNNCGVRSCVMGACR